MRNLGSLEQEVMQRVWRREGPVTVRQMAEEIGRERSIAYTTVMTVMEHLHGKGLLGRERVGRAYRYEPTASRASYTAQMMEEVLASTEDSSATLMHFVAGISDAERAELERAISEVKARS